MTFVKPRSLATLAILVTLAFGALAQSGPQPKLPTTPLTFGMRIVQAELAVTPEQQMIGMMFRTQMGPFEGMLFVSEEPGVRCFWMRNTLIPLSIAFIADDGTIVNTDEMQPRTEESHCSKKPVRFVLEMPAGWFTKHGIGPGFKVRGAPFKSG